MLDHKPEGPLCGCRAMAVGNRRDLIKGLWPDKALYGSTLLFLTAVLGLVHGLSLTLLTRWTTFTVSDNVPAILRFMPPEAILFFSLAAAILAYVALRRQRSELAMAGAAAGVFSFALLGLGSALSLLALGFILLSRVEGEHEEEETLALDESMWPDKALAASVVLLVSSVLTLGWGLALAFDALAFSGYTSDPTAFGWAAALVGIVGLVASAGLYYQRMPLLAVLASVGGILALGLYIVGPLLSLVALVLVYKAWKEDEFEDAQDARRAQATGR